MVIKIHYTNNGYTDLANAIIIQACNDYLKGKITEKVFDNFCKSGWFSLLTEVDGKCIMDNMHKRYKQKWGDVNDEKTTEEKRT